MKRNLFAIYSAIYFLGLAAPILGNCVATDSPQEVQKGPEDVPAQTEEVRTSPPDSDGEVPPELPATVAEKSDYRATSTSAEVLTFIDVLAERTAYIRRVDFGKTVEGRSIAAIVVANPPIPSASAIPTDSRLVVMIVGNIHSGECAGKEALLELLRTLANDPTHPWLKNLVLVFVPNFNADGNDRIAPGNRPHQIGPEDGMGWRANAQGLDLNRDFIKLETPECRSLVQLIDRWNPHLFIDMHTTNGSRHRYVLTYDAPHNPASPEPIRRYLREKMLPAVTQQLSQRQIETFFYGNFNTDHTQWTTYGDSPRYSIEYLGLRGRLAILSEAYAYASYRQRIDASREFVRECLDYVAKHRDVVHGLTKSADLSAIEAGKCPVVGDCIPLASKVEAFPEKVTVQGYKRVSENPEKQENEDGITSPQEPEDYQVDFLGDYHPTREAQRPFAYLLPRNESRVADRLRMHGIRIEQLMEKAVVDVEYYQIVTVKRAKSSYQRHRQQSVSVEKRKASREFAEGTYVIHTGQPLGNLIVYLLEPRSEDGLLAWNFFESGLVVDREFTVQRITSAVALKTSDVDSITPLQQLSLDKIYGPTGRLPLAPSPVTSKWVSGTNFYSQKIGDRTVHVDADSGAIRPVPKTTGLAEALAALPEIDPQDAKTMASQSGQRDNSGKAILINWSNDLFYWKEGNARALRLTHDSDKEQYATFSPNGQLVAFVRNHNLHVVDVETAKVRALTTQGNEDLLHGQLDWVYQEELYGRGKYRAFWWSPDSRWLALLRLDQSSVPHYTVTDNIPHHPRSEITRYPVAGDPNSKVDLGVVRAAGGSVRWIDHQEYHLAELLISRVDWSTDSRYVAYQLQNREQTWLDLRTADPTNGKAKTLFRETTKAWVSVLGPPVWLEDGSFLWLSERSGNKHIYHVSGDGKKCDPVTSGPWDVGNIYGAGKDQQWIYFLGTKDHTIAPRGYRVQLDGTQLKCLTPQPGSHRIRLNEAKTFFLDTSSTVNAPASVRLFRADGEYLRTVDPNLDDRLKYYDLGTTEFHQVKARDGLLLDAMLIKPVKFDPSQKYPVVCYVYSGPQSPVVWDRWLGQTYLWHQMLAQKGYAIWLFNNRSASTKGAKYAWTSYKKLGQQELLDIEDGLVWLGQQSWVDMDRIGIWGWSYGGYMSSYALTHSKSFKVGMAVAPVTDWHNYDSIYTERYMDLPHRNPAGYLAGSVVDAAENLHGRLLLVHGTIDDNVHLSNAMQLVNALQNAGKQFDLMLYPGNRHGISRSQQSRHLRESLTRFLLEHL